MSTSNEWYHLPGCNKDTQPRAQIMNEIREVPFLSSNLGYVVMDIDCSVYNYNTGNMIYIEDKCYLADPTWWQTKKLQSIAQYTTNDHFKGVFLMQHQYKGTLDGYTKLSVLNKESGNWEPIPSASVYTLRSNDIWRFVENILLYTKNTKGTTI